MIRSLDGQRVVVVDERAARPLARHLVLVLSRLHLEATIRDLVALGTAQREGS